MTELREVHENDVQELRDLVRDLEHQVRHLSCRFQTSKLPLALGSNTAVSFLL